jgi:hypothetical protein
MLAPLVVVDLPQALGAAGGTAADAGMDNDLARQVIG